VHVISTAAVAAKDAATAAELEG